VDGRAKVRFHHFFNFFGACSLNYGSGEYGRSGNGNFGNRGLVARSLSLPTLIAVGAISAVWLATAQSGVVRGAEAQSGMASADPARGRALFVSKGCVACHAINEVGGTSAPPLDVESAPGEIDPLDFVARMWRGAEAMIFMQQQELGAQIDFTGRELADIIAFAHDPEEQRKFSEADMPPELRHRIRDQ
jgi:mono/diheme cytochrome c family protein